MGIWFKAPRPHVGASEIHALADWMLDGCKHDSELRVEMLLTQRDRYALWFLRPRLFQSIAAAHGELVASRRVAMLDEWLEANEIGVPGARRR
jgi:hypothetical protein